MSSQAGKQSELKPGRVTRIRELCCRALDLMRESACLTNADDPFAGNIHGAIVDIALTLDAVRPTRRKVVVSKRRYAITPRVRRPGT